MANSTPQYPDPETFENVWAQLVSSSWSDPALKQQLQNDPTAALSQKGVKFPASVKVKAQDGASGVTVVLPLPNQPARIGEARLDASADDDGGSVTLSCSCCCSC